MNHPDHGANPDIIRLSHFLRLTALLWTVMIAVFLWLSYSNSRAEALNIARFTARNSIERDLLYRRWAAGHGGVYVPVSATTPPSPYLSHIPERDLTTPSGRKLTLINPAYMTRQVYEFEASLNPGRPQAHITSDRPLRATNAADPWELAALGKLKEEGLEEYSSQEVITGIPVLRMIRPMVTALPCLQCHLAQGYKLGDLRGGLSVSIPLAPIFKDGENDFLAAVTGLTTAWVCGMGGLWLAGRQLRRRIGEREKSQSALRRSEQKYRQLFENMTTAFALHEIVCDDAGRPVDYRFIEMNPAFEKVTGASAAALTGRTVLEVMPQTEQYWIEAFGQVALTGKPIAYENYSQEFGRYFDTWCFSPTPGQFAVIFSDISERKRIEVEREQLLIELGNKNRELEGMIYTASHDLRSPLVNIHGFSQRLEKHCQHLTEELTQADGSSEMTALRSILSDKIPEDLGFIRSSVSKMNGLIDGLLRLSRIGRDPLELRPIDMKGLLEEVVRGMRYQIDLTDGEVVIAKEIPPCHGDVTQLGQVLSNLLDNALKYRQEERKLRVTVDGWREQNHLYYRVSDNGRGISPECLNRICEVFYRADPMNSPPGEGLGLTLIQRIINRHGGNLTIASTVGEGSSFTFSLPDQP